MSLAVMIERKPSSIKHTVAKIKTKIHNTSSFFKLSLKTNNKALALALAAQKQKTRQLETETVRLQKYVQSLNFDLAIQRHKNTQMFTILREFYNNSVNCMAKAVDLISKEESAKSLDSENTEDACQIEKDLSAVLPEQRKTSPLKCTHPDELKTSRVNGVSMVPDNQPHDSSPKENTPCPEIDQTAPHNTLYDSEMEITVVDSAAEIVMVQTKPRRHFENDEEECQDTRKSSVTSSSGTASIVAFNKDPEDESCNLKDVTMIDSGETQLLENMSVCTSVCSSENEGLPRQPEPLCRARDSITARRKTQSFSRPAKNKRCNSQKVNAGFLDARKTYTITPLSSESISNCSNLDDFFSDTEGQDQRKSKKISHVNPFPKEKDIECESEAEKLQNKGTDLRKTFVIPDKSKPKRSRKTKISSSHTDLFQESAVLFDASSLDETESTTVPNSLNVLQKISNEKEKPHSKRQKPNVRKNRATYVVSASQNIVNIDTVNETIDVLDEDTAPNVLMENKRRTESQLTEEHRGVELEDPCMPENRPCEKNLVKNKHKENVSKTSEAGFIKPKKLKLGEIKKVKKKNVKTGENASGKQRAPKCSSNQDDEIHVLPHSVKKNCTSIGSSQLPLEESHVPAFEETFMNKSIPKPKRTTTVLSRTFNDNEDCSISCDTGTTSRMINTRHSRQSYTQDLKSRETFVVKSSSYLELTGKENASRFNSSFEESSMLVPNQSHDSHSTPRKTDQLGQTHCELFDEERPPWESLDCRSYVSPTCYSLVNNDRESQRTSRTTDIYEESGLNSTHRSPAGRAMKSLTNTDLTADAPARTRRKAAPVSYREPSLNCKMRRGDKYSDTRFLSSPLFKDKKKRLKKKNDSMTCE